MKSIVEVFHTRNIESLMFWSLVVQTCVISVSIAAGSISLVFLLLTVIILILKERKWIVPSLSIDIPFIAYIIIEYVSTFLSSNHLQSLYHSKRLLLILIVYAVVRSFRTKQRVNLAVKILTCTVALLSLFEIFSYYSSGIERLFVFQIYMTTGGLKMIITLMLIPFVIGQDTPAKDRVFYSAALIPTIFALMLTNTRSSWLGFIAGVIVISILYYRKLFVVLVVAVVLFFSFAPQHQVQRAKSIIDLTDGSNASRLNMWSTGLRMWQDRPLLGFGDIDLMSTYLTYRTPTGDEPAGHLHNNYIHLLVTIGAVGLAAVLFLFYRILQAEYAIFSSFKNRPHIRNIALGSIAAFTGFLVNGIFEWNFGDHEIMVFVWFTVGLCIAVGNIGKSESL